jgi:hypothetical protein
MASWPVFVVAGAVIGLLIGLFGVGALRSPRRYLRYSVFRDYWQ